MRDIRRRRRMNKKNDRFETRILFFVFLPLLSGSTNDEDLLCRQRRNFGELGAFEVVGTVSAARKSFI